MKFFDAEGSTLSPYSKVIAAAVASSLILYAVGWTGSWLLGISGPSFHDFSTYYMAADRFLNGQSVYTDPATIPNPSSVPSDFVPLYVYPPLFAVLFVPFALLNFWVASWTYLVCVSVLFTAATGLLLRNLDRSPSKGETTFIAVAVIGFFPFKQWAYMGQVTLLLTAALTVSVALLYGDSRDRQSLIGVCAVLAVYVKPYYAPTGAHLFRTRRLLAAGATLMGLSLLGVLLMGVDATQTYVEILTTNPVRQFEWNGGPYNPLYALGEFKWAVRIPFLLVAAALAFVGTRLIRDDLHPYLFCFGVGTMLVAAPGVKFYTLVTLVPTYIVLVHEEFGRSDGLPALVFVSIGLVQAHRYVIKYGFEIAVSHDISWLPILLPIVQPALWGALIVVTLSAGRIVQGIRGPNGMD